MVARRGQKTAAGKALDGTRLGSGPEPQSNKGSGHRAEQNRVRNFQAYSRVHLDQQVPVDDGAGKIRVRPDVGLVEYDAVADPGALTDNGPFSDNHVPP